MFRRADIRKLNKFDRVYILATGGKDSTFTALNLWELRFWVKTKVYLLFNDTGVETKEGKHNLSMLEDKTWELITLASEAVVSENPLKIVRDSFLRIPEAKRLLDEGKYSKKVFPCCNILKESPFEKWLKEEDHSNDCFVLSIGIGDGWQRRRWLLRLRKEEKKFHLNSRRKVWYWYPLRDIVTLQIKSYLSKDRDFYVTPHTGCLICPIMVIFGKPRDGIRFHRSMKVYLNLVKKGEVELVEELLERYNQLLEKHGTG